MLSTVNRLKEQADFAEVRLHGRRWRSDLLTVSTLLRETGKPSRFGFVVSRRIGKAVTRNRVKRRLRAIIRRYAAEMATGFDVVIVARPAASTASFVALHDASLDLLRRAELIPSLPEVSR